MVTMSSLIAEYGLAGRVHRNDWLCCNCTLRLPASVIAVCDDDYIHTWCHNCAKDTFGHPTLKSFVFISEEGLPSREYVLACLKEGLPCA